MATTTAEWIEELKGISVLELTERIKALEEEFGVSATAVAAAAPAGGGGGDGAAAEEEQSTFDVILTAAGDKKIQVIKVVRAVDRPGPQGGQGARRRGAQARQGGHRARRGRQAQGRARGGRRERRGQVARATAHLRAPRGALPGALRASGVVRDALASPSAVRGERRRASGPAPRYGGVPRELSDRRPQVSMTRRRTGAARSSSQGHRRCRSRPRPPPSRRATDRRPRSRTTAGGPPDRRSRSSMPQLARPSSAPRQAHAPYPRNTARPSSCAAAP